MNYKKITKGQARKLFNAGKEIYLHTNKLSWNNMWQNPMPATKDFEEEKSAMELHERWKDAEYEQCRSIWIDRFDLLVNEYAYYNCDNERGNVVIYLIAQ